MNQPLNLIRDLSAGFGKERKSIALFRSSHSANCSMNYSRMSEVTRNYRETKILINKYFDFADTFVVRLSENLSFIDVQCSREKRCASIAEN